MATSFVEFKGKGFWVRDAALEIWLRMLVYEIDKLHDAPDWLRQAREHWYIHATVGMTGCISANLDDFATGDERTATILSLSKRAMKELRKHGKIITQAQLNSIFSDERGNSFTADADTEHFTIVGKYFMRLLRDDLYTDASTSHNISDEYRRSKYRTES